MKLPFLFSSKIFSSLIRKPCTHEKNLFKSSFPLLETITLIFISADLFIMVSSHTLNVEFKLWTLWSFSFASSTWHIIFKINLCCSMTQYFNPSNNWITFYFMLLPHFLHPFTQHLDCFVPPFDYCDEGYCEHVYKNIWVPFSVLWGV